MKLARTLSVIGRVMITAGVLILLFVVYQLWGTGLHTKEAQADARNDFDAAIEDAGAAPVDDEPDTEVVERSGQQPIPHAPPHAGQVALIQIPAIGKDELGELQEACVTAPATR